MHACARNGRNKPSKSFDYFEIPIHAEMRGNGTS